MRVAAIYDIHGNLPALEAVLGEIHGEGVDQIIVGGDVVPGPMPRESVSALLDCSIPVRSIRGNGESAILAARRGEELTRVPERVHEAIRWVAHQLPAEHLSAFAAWPLTLEVEIPGLGDVVFCHATPRDDNEIFTRLTPDRRLRSVFEATKASVVICGHTHMQFDRTLGDLRVVNAGSVGMPFGDPGAYWALLGPGIELRHTPYDLVDATEWIRATAYPQAAEFEVLQPPPESKMLELFEAARRKRGSLDAGG